jgi:phenylacetate-coenzyme A ligase PaaK-like adenylate-forming protein
MGPLDRWLLLRMGLPDAPTPPSREELRDWQLARLRETVAHARQHSPFYARHLDNADPLAFGSLEDLSRLPAITPEDVREAPEKLLCVSQDEIARVVTLQSSGTTGRPKRIFNTGDDLEGTKEFFNWGMRNMVEPGETALVLLPGERPGGVGRLLGEALSRFGARVAAHGVLEDAEAAVDQLMDEGASCIVGSPAHVNLMACVWEARGLPRHRVKSVLLCWDAIPEAVVRNCTRIFGCRTFRHWGMIETGLGGAVECAPGSGMHLREAELYMEIVDPATGALLPDGEYGEMVVTTLLRRGMPLIRYRTGDTGRILPSPCSCNSPLRRIDPCIRRARAGMETGPVRFTLDDLAEPLYGLDGLGDFGAWLGNGLLRIKVSGADQAVAEKVRPTLETVPAVRQALKAETIALEIYFEEGFVPAVPGLGKRTIQIIPEN